MFLVFALTVAAVSYKLRPVGVVWVSTATMLLPRTASGGSTESALSVLGGQREAPGSALDTQIAIIESRPFTKRVRDTVRGRFLKEKKTALVPLVDGASFDATAPTSPELVDVTVTSGNEAVSVALANASVEVYAKRLVERGDKSTDENVNFVGERLKAAEKALNKAKLDLQNYKQENKIFDIASALATSNAAIETLKEKESAARIEAQAGPAAASVSNDGITQTLQQRASEAKLKYDAQLRLFFPSAPEAREAEADWRAAQGLADRRLRALLAQNQQAARDTARALDEARRNGERLPAIEFRLSQLQADLEQKAATFKQLSDRFTTLNLSRAAKAATADPVQKAESAMGVSRTWSRAVSTALLCAIVLAGLCALLLEQLDRTLHSVTDLEPLLPAAVLGTMPLLRGRAERRLAHMTGAQPMAPQVLEACRIVRSNLSFATMSSPAQTILITSAAPGEGKSLSALNLATVTAFDGRRVLLLDCDLRRPSQHTLNGLPLEPGFTNLLSGEATIDEAVQATKVSNLWVMTAGTLPLNPPELLGSPETRRFLQEFKDRFDVVVIDSPPVLALTDAQVLCSQVDGVVMIVAAESTGKDEVQRAQAMLRHAGGRLLGAVFNKVRRGSATPGYGTYQNYGGNPLHRDRALADSVGTLARR
jgi:capsular exopolysaccharide synthesis family protein